MREFTIPAVGHELTTALQGKIDNKTKPPGSLGKLEQVALQVGRIQNTLTPALTNPSMVVFAGDHGIATEGVSPFPQEVTFQMVMNFLAGGAGINVFCQQHGIRIQVVDAGVNHTFDPHPELVDAKIGMGTRSFLQEPAMEMAECQRAVDKGAEIVAQLADKGCNVIGFGEMGIGNTSAAAALMSLFCDMPIEDCIGRGTGMDDAGLLRKKSILRQALAKNPVDKTPMTILRTFGGFEIAMMCGAMLEAASQRMILLIDGFIATSALLAARAMHPAVLDYCIFTHVSDEKGHQTMLGYLKAEPLVGLGMRLGEGTGAAVVFPIIDSAVRFLNEMASFESAQVSQQQ